MILLYVVIIGNVLPLNVKVSAPSSRNLGRFQVFFFNAFTFLSVISKLDWFAGQ